MKFWAKIETDKQRLKMAIMIEFILVSLKISFKIK
jgi:hypothetical protein